MKPREKFDAHEMHKLRQCIYQVFNFHVLFYISGVVVSNERSTVKQTFNKQTFLFC